MNWNDLNQVGPYDLEFLGQEIHEEFIKEFPQPIKLTEKEAYELAKVEHRMYLRWAISQWLTWQPFQIIVFILLILIL